MLFTSYEFIAFLIAIIVLYYLIPKKFQWILLLVGSYVFYAFAGLHFLLFIAATTVTTYLAARQITRIQSARAAQYESVKADLDRDGKKAFKAATKKKTGLWFIACLILNIGILAVIKYTDFFITNVNSIFNSELPLAGFAVPLGISYYTFKSVGYLIDVNRGKYPCQDNLAKFALFVSFFPQVIQGPISRYDKLSESLFAEHRFDGRVFRSGLIRVLWGFFKKLVIADRLVAPVKALAGSPDQYQGAYVLLLILLYAIQLYADFTGGIDIAIGIGEMCGIGMEENFLTPYFSKNINEYWTRWHITMGTWFKDYIFYPISVSGWMLKLSKNSREKLGKAVGKRVPVYIANIIVWFATGLWHGAAWNFIVWGMLNCVVTVASYEMEPLYEKFHSKCKWASGIGYDIWQMLRTFWLMGAIRILDVYRDVPVSFAQLGSIFSGKGWSSVWSSLTGELSMSVADLLVILAGIIMMLVVSIVFYKNKNKKRVRDIIMERGFSLQAAVIVVLAIAILIYGAYGIGYDANQFIYNQF